MKERLGNLRSLPFQFLSQIRLRFTQRLQSHHQADESRRQVQHNDVRHSMLGTSRCRGRLEVE